MIDLFIQFRVFDIIDIILVALLFFWFYRILKGTSAISTVSADSNDKRQAIYDLQGRKAGLSDDWERLPSGVYIRNGRKVVR